MPQVGFTCPDGADITYDRCFKECRMGKRCLPLLLLMEVADTRPTVDGVYHVTEVLKPPKQAFLERVHNYFKPPLDGVNSTFGTLWHLLMERRGRKVFHIDTEVNFIALIPTTHGDIYLSGTCDAVDHLERESHDWKTTTTFHVAEHKSGDFSGENWVEQQSVYKPFLFPNIPTNKIVAVYREWGERMSSKCDMVEQYTLPMMPEDEALTMIVERIETLAEIELDGAEPRDCTAKSGVNGSANECWEGWDRNTKTTVRRKCRKYCGGKEVCEQYQTWKEGR